MRTLPVLYEPVRQRMSFVTVRLSRFKSFRLHLVQKSQHEPRSGLYARTVVLVYDYVRKYGTWYIRNNNLIRVPLSTRFNV